MICMWLLPVLLALCSLETVVSIECAKPLYDVDGKCKMYKSERKEECGFLKDGIASICPELDQMLPDIPKWSVFLPYSQIALQPAQVGNEKWLAELRLNQYQDAAYYCDDLINKGKWKGSGYFHSTWEFGLQDIKDWFEDFKDKKPETRTQSFYMGAFNSVSASVEVTLFGFKVEVGAGSTTTTTMGYTIGWDWVDDKLICALDFNGDIGVAFQLGTGFKTTPASGKASVTLERGFMWGVSWDTFYRPSDVPGKYNLDIGEAEIGPEAEISAGFVSLGVSPAVGGFYASVTNMADNKIGNIGGIEVAMSTGVSYGGDVSPTGGISASASLGVEFGYARGGGVTFLFDGTDGPKAEHSYFKKAGLDGSFGKVTGRANCPNPVLYERTWIHQPHKVEKWKSDYTQTTGRYYFSHYTVTTIHGVCVFASYKCDANAHCDAGHVIDALELASSTGYYVCKKRSGCCTKCDAGKFAEKPRRLKARYMIQNAVGPFYLSPQDATTCKECPAGRWQDQQGQNECKKCVAGKYSSEIGATTNVCKNCAAGYYGNEQGQATCYECKDRWQDQEGQTTCKDCPQGQYMTGNHETISDCNDCPRGWAAWEYDTHQQNNDNTTGLYCSKCGIGGYQDLSGKKTKGGCFPIVSDNSPDIGEIFKQHCEWRVIYPDYFQYSRCSIETMEFALGKRVSETPFGPEKFRCHEFELLNRRVYDPETGDYLKIDRPLIHDLRPTRTDWHWADDDKIIPASPFTSTTEAYYWVPFVSFGGRCRYNTQKTDLVKTSSGDDLTKWQCNTIAWVTTTQTALCQNPDIGDKPTCEGSGWKWMPSTPSSGSGECHWGNTMKGARVSMIKRATDIGINGHGSQTKVRNITNKEECDNIYWENEDDYSSGRFYKNDPDFRLQRRTPDQMRDYWDFLKLEKLPVYKHYQDQKGENKCRLCSIGQTATHSGTECQTAATPTGTQNSGNMNYFSICPHNWKPKDDKTGCEQCPEGRTSRGLYWSSYINSLDPYVSFGGAPPVRETCSCTKCPTGKTSLNSLNYHGCESGFTDTNAPKTRLYNDINANDTNGTTFSTVSKYRKFIPPLVSYEKGGKVIEDYSDTRSYDDIQSEFFETFDTPDIRLKCFPYSRGYAAPLIYTRTDGDFDIYMGTLNDVHVFKHVNGVLRRLHSKKHWEKMLVSGVVNDRSIADRIIFYGNLSEWLVIDERLYFPSEKMESRFGEVSVPKFSSFFSTEEATYLRWMSKNILTDDEDQKKFHNDLMTELESHCGKIGATTSDIPPLFQQIVYDNHNIPDGYVVDHPVKIRVRLAMSGNDMLINSHDGIQYLQKQGSEYVIVKTILPGLGKDCSPTLVENIMEGNATKLFATKLFVSCNSKIYDFGDFDVLRKNVTWISPYDRYVMYDYGSYCSRCVGTTTGGCTRERLIQHEPPGTCTEKGRCLFRNQDAAEAFPNYIKDLEDRIADLTIEQCWETWRPYVLKEEDLFGSTIEQCYDGDTLVEDYYGLVEDYYGSCTSNGKCVVDISQHLPWNMFTDKDACNEGGSFLESYSDKNIEKPFEWSAYTSTTVGNLPTALALSFYDVDDDGDKDMFVGKGDGKLDYIENLGEVIHSTKPTKKCIWTPAKCTYVADNQEIRTFIHSWAASSCTIATIKTYTTENGARQCKRHRGCYRMGGPGYCQDAAAVRGEAFAEMCWTSLNSEWMPTDLPEFVKGECNCANINDRETCVSTDNVVSSTIMAWDMNNVDTAVPKYKGTNVKFRDEQFNEIDVGDFAVPTFDPEGGLYIGNKTGKVTYYYQEIDMFDEKRWTKWTENSNHVNIFSHKRKSNTCHAEGTYKFCVGAIYYQTAADSQSEPIKICCPRWGILKDSVVSPTTSNNTTAKRHYVHKNKCCHRKDNAMMYDRNACCPRNGEWFNPDTKSCDCYLNKHAGLCCALKTYMLQVQSNDTDPLLCCPAYGHAYDPDEKDPDEKCRCHEDMEMYRGECCLIKESGEATVKPSSCCQKLGQRFNTKKRRCQCDSDLGWQWQSGTGCCRRREAFDNAQSEPDLRYMCCKDFGKKNSGSSGCICDGDNGFYDDTNVAGTCCLEKETSDLSQKTSDLSQNTTAWLNLMLQFPERTGIEKYCCPKAGEYLTNKQRITCGCDMEAGFINARVGSDDVCWKCPGEVYATSKTEERNSFERTDLTCRLIPTVETEPVPNMKLKDAPVVCPDHYFLSGYTYWQYHDAFYKSGGTCKQCPSGYENIRDVNHWIGSTSSRPDTTSTTCQLCPKDHYTEARGGPCVSCPNGKGRKAGDTTGICSDCPKGKFSDDIILTTDAFTWAWDDWHKTIREITWDDSPQDYDDDPMCSFCPSGKTAASGQSTCVNCPTGKISSFKSKGLCETCDSSSVDYKSLADHDFGFYIYSYDQAHYQTCFTISDIQGCPPGKFCLGDASTCEDLRKPTKQNPIVGAGQIKNFKTNRLDTYTADVSLKCAACPKGKYKSNYGSGSLDTCLACPAGFRSTGTSCQSCPKDIPIASAFVNRTRMFRTSKNRPRIASGDIDNDGILDIILCTADGLLAHYKQNGGTFDELFGTDNFMSKLGTHKQVLKTTTGLTLENEPYLKDVRITTLVNETTDMPGLVLRDYSYSDQPLSPTLVDWNEDSYLDLVVGTDKFIQIYYFDISSMRFDPQPTKLTDIEFENPVPAFGSFLGNNILIVGESNGKLSWIGTQGGILVSKIYLLKTFDEPVVPAAATWDGRSMVIFAGVENTVRSFRVTWQGEPELTEVTGLFVYTPKPEKQCDTFADEASCTDASITEGLCSWTNFYSPNENICHHSYVIRNQTGSFMNEKLIHFAPTVADFDGDSIPDMLVAHEWYMEKRQFTDGIAWWTNWDNWRTLLSDGNFIYFKGVAAGFEEVTVQTHTSSKQRSNPENPMYGVDVSLYRGDYSTFRTCSACPTGKVAFETGLTSVQQCKTCALGQRIENYKCVDCDLEKERSLYIQHASGVTESVCIPYDKCGAGEYSVDNMFCYNGAHIKTNATSESECLVPGTCDKSTYIEKTDCQINNGTWSSSNTWEMYSSASEIRHKRCDACPGGQYKSDFMAICVVCPSGYYSEITYLEGDAVSFSWSSSEYPSLYGLSGQSGSTATYSDIQNKISEWNDTGAVHVILPKVLFYIRNKTNHTIDFAIDDLESTGQWESMGQWFDYEEDICVDNIGVEDLSRRSSTSYKEAVGFTTANCTTGGSCIIVSKSLETPSHSTVWGCIDPTYTDETNCESNGRCSTTYGYTTKVLCETNGNATFEEVYFDQQMNSFLGYCRDTSVTNATECQDKYDGGGWVQNVWQEGISAVVHTNNYKLDCETTTGFTWIDTSYYTGACIDSTKTTGAACANTANRKWIPNTVEKLKTGIRLLTIKKPGQPVQQGPSECKLCPSSKPASVTGTCYACSDDKGYVDGQCTLCPSGWYASDSACIECSEGKYHALTQDDFYWTDSCVGESYFLNDKCHFNSINGKRLNPMEGETAYYIRTEGVCEEIIESKNECATAVTELELTATTDFQYHQFDKPTGCIYNPKKPISYPGAWFNPDDTPQQFKQLAATLKLAGTVTEEECTQEWQCVCKRTNYMSEDSIVGFNCPLLSDCRECGSEVRKNMFLDKYYIYLRERCPQKPILANISHIIMNLYNLTELSNSVKLRDIVNINAIIPHSGEDDSYPYFDMSALSYAEHYLKTLREWNMSSPSGSCRTCPSGYYQWDSGQTSCKKCPIGGNYIGETSVASSSVESCNECVAGSYLNTGPVWGQGNIQCSECGASGSLADLYTYQSEHAKTSCIKCPAGWQVTNYTANITISGGILITAESHGGSIDGLKKGDSYGDTGYIITNVAYDSYSKKIGVMAEKTQNVAFDPDNATHLSQLVGSKACVRCPAGKYKSEDTDICEKCYGDAEPTEDQTDCLCGEEGDTENWFFKRDGSEKTCRRLTNLVGICDEGIAYGLAVIDHLGNCHECNATEAPVCVDNFAYCNTTNYDCIAEREPWKHPTGCVNDCIFVPKFDCVTYNTTSCLECFRNGTINETWFKPPCQTPFTSPGWIVDDMTEREMSSTTYLELGKLTCLRDCGAITYNCPTHDCTYEYGARSNCCHRCKSDTWTTSSAKYRKFMENGCDPQDAPWLRNCSDYTNADDCNAEDDICEWKVPDSTPWADSCASTCVRYRNNQFNAFNEDMDNSICSCPSKMDECYHYCGAEWKTFIRNECDSAYAPQELLKDPDYDACDNSVSAGQKWEMPRGFSGASSDYCVGDCDASTASTCYKWEFHIPAQPAVVAWSGSKCDNANNVVEIINGDYYGGLGDCSSEATDLENGLIANPPGTWPPGDESVCTAAKSACKDASDCTWYGNYYCYAQYLQEARTEYKPTDMTPTETFAEYCSRQGGTHISIDDIKENKGGGFDETHGFDQCLIPITVAEGQTCEGQNGTDLTDVIKPAQCVNIDESCYSDCEPKWKDWIETTQNEEFGNVMFNDYVNGVQPYKFYPVRCNGHPRYQWGGHEYGCPAHEKLKAENGICPAKWEKPATWDDDNDRDDYCLANCPRATDNENCVPANHRCFTQQFRDKYPCTPAWQTWANNGCSGDPPWDETTNENTKYGCPRVEFSGTELAYPADKGRCEKPNPWSNSCASSCYFEYGQCCDWLVGGCDETVPADKKYIDYLNGGCTNATKPWDGIVVAKVAFWPEPIEEEFIAGPESEKICVTKKIVNEVENLDIYKRYLTTQDTVEEFIPFYDVPLQMREWNDYERGVTTTLPECSQQYFLNQTTERWQQGDCEWLNSTHVCAKKGDAPSECFSGTNCNDLYYYETQGLTKIYFKSTTGQCWPNGQYCYFMAEDINLYDIYDPKYGQECVSMDCGLAESVYNNQCMEDNTAVICQDASTYFYKNCITCS